MKCYLLFVIIILAGCQSVEKKEETSEGQVSTQMQVMKVESTPADGVILDHGYFKIFYSKEHRQPKWVQYTLTKEDLEAKKATRRNKFFADPLLKKMNIDAVKPTDYVRSGYTRGHMAPSEDFTRSQEANDETFVMSNMIPQKQVVNGGSWAKLEKAIRGWACGEGKVIVITGPVLKEGLPKLKSGVSIPDKFFKAVYDLTPPVKSVCFIYSQTDSGVSPEERVLSVSDCEKEAGVSLSVDHSLKATENKSDLSDWKSGKCN